MDIHQPVIDSGGELRPTYVEVNLTRLEENLAAIRERVSPAKVMLILKANAYGHGLAAVARDLAEKADYIAVAVLEEGIFLRKAGIRTPILVLGGVWERQIPDFLRYDLTLTASSVERLEQINAAAEATEAAMEAMANKAGEHLSKMVDGAREKAEASIKKGVGKLQSQLDQY